MENEGKLAVVNGTDIVLPNDNVIYNLSAYEFGGIINITFVDGEDLTVIYEQYDNINAYRAEGNFTAPEKVGYVFGGWYSAANEDSAYTVETIKTGTVFYAKFVPEKILYAGVQITAGTNANSESTNIRLVSSVDNLKYLNVRFTLNRGTLGNDIVCTSDKVYEKITPYDNEGNELEGVKPSYIFGSAANYFTTHIITGVPNSAFNTELTLTASWQTKDGTWVNSGRKTIFSVSDVMDSLED